MNNNQQYYALAFFGATGDLTYKSNPAANAKSNAGEEKCVVAQTESK